MTEIPCRGGISTAERILMFDKYVVAVSFMSNIQPVKYRSFKDLDEAREYADDMIDNRFVEDVCIYQKTSL